MFWMFLDLRRICFGSKDMLCKLEERGVRVFVNYISGWKRSLSFLIVGDILLGLYCWRMGESGEIRLRIVDELMTG